MPPIQLKLRSAIPADLEACMIIRGQTRDNPISREVLVSYGVTTESWSHLMSSQSIIGSVFENDKRIVAFAFADTKSAEILVVALLPEFESMGLGKALLNDMIEKLKKLGHNRIWLAAAPDPQMRAYGFYRHLGWTSTGVYDDHGDEIMELTF